MVTVFHNTRPYLEEAIQSVLQQSYSAWELLLVDDGSTDGSDVIARRYAEQDRRIRYLQHPGGANRGISATRNLGTAAAGGAYIAQLDSDDVLLPFHLERQVRLLENNPGAALVYGPVQRWYSWNDEAPADAPEDFVARPLDAYDTCLHPPELIPIMLQRSFCVPLGFLARREAIEDVGGYEDEFEGMYDDQVFLCKLGLRHQVYASGTWSYRYRRHPDSIVSVTNRQGEKLPNRIRFLRWLEEYLIREGIRDRRVWRSLRQELWKCRHPEVISRWEQIMDVRDRVAGRLTKIWKQHRESTALDALPKEPRTERSSS